jgi:hypothetical protein
MTVSQVNSLVAPPAAGLPAVVAQAVATLALATVATLFPLIAHFSGQPIGLAACVLLGALIANFATATVPTVLIFSYLFQNLFVSILSPHIAVLDDFNAIRGYNFVLTASIWMVVAAHYWTSRRRFDRRFITLMNVGFFALGVIGFYFALGLLGNPRGAAVYLRNVATPFLLFHCFALVAYRHRVALHATFLVMAWALVVYGYCETFMHDRLFAWTSGGTYLELASRLNDPMMWLRELEQNGRVLRSYLDTLMMNFLNTPLLGIDLVITRLIGPNFHPISYAYALCFFSLVLVATGNLFYLVAVFPLLLLIGSKGSLVFLFFTIGGLIVSRFFRRRNVFFWLYAAALGAWAAAGVVIGLKAGDYHVIGFIGGIEGFLHNPIGHGLGAGGNLRLDTTQIDWSKSQHSGQTDIAVESAVGVLLYQMGIGGVVILALAAWMMWRVWLLYVRTDDRLCGIAALGLFTILMNGIFQEEALFAPLAFGMMMAFAGILIGRHCRAAPMTGRRASRRNGEPPSTRVRLATARSGS